MYRTIESSTYADPKVKKLPSDGKFLFVYLVTNEMTDFSGIYHAPYVLIASQTGISEKHVKEMLDQLQELGLVLHDDESEVVWVVNMMKYQLHSSKMLKGALARLRSLHSLDLILGFLLHYRDELSSEYDYEDMVSKYQDIYIQKNGYAYPESGICISGFSQKPGYVPVPVPVPVPTPVDEVEKERPISYDRVIELWNEVAGKYGLPQVRKLTDELKGAIKKASRVLPHQNDWDDLFAEIPLSSTLQGRIGDGKWAPSLGWLLKQNKGESEPNYAKAMNGAWRDKNTGGMSELARRNIEAAEQALNRMGIPTKAQTFILKGITDGSPVEDGHSGIPGEVGDGLWTDAEYGEDRDLPGGPGGVYAGAGADGDYLGQEESREISDDRGFEDSDRGE
jgi:hypothetical protein